MRPMNPNPIPASTKMGCRHLCSEGKEGITAHVHLMSECSRHTGAGADLKSILQKPEACNKADPPAGEQQYHRKRTVDAQEAFTGRPHAQKSSHAGPDRPGRAIEIVDEPKIAFHSPRKQDNFEGILKGGHDQDDSHERCKAVAHV
jgi:hypothetical protein